MRSYYSCAQIKIQLYVLLAASTSRHVPPFLTYFIGWKRRVSFTELDNTGMRLAKARIDHALRNLLVVIGRL